MSKQSLLIDNKGQYLLFDEATPPPKWSDILLHFANPKNDNERALNEQYSYKAQNDKTALTRLYKILLPIVQKFITLKAKQNQSIAKLTKDERAIKAMDTTSAVIIRYLENPNFYVKRNFPSAVYYFVLKALYRKKVDDKRVIFDTEVLEKTKLGYIQGEGL